ncbi:hypothetical protein DFP72DRAFT_1064897 [Ephemerocybe angulata]|uniref:Uncharacterized protein n=1 Tax=Ephemerocybe angulata TaxID=980116 RepID=A0A8H6I3D7_9AGAR|nr:hypothetical protein DFP72DRAFT_1064897 [Tulosesus angulatus]
MGTRAGKEVESNTDTRSTNGWSEQMLKHFDEGFMLYEEYMGLAEAVSPTSWTRDMFISNYVWDQCEDFVPPSDVRKQVDSVHTLRVLPLISRLTNAPTRQLFVPALEREPLFAFKVYFQRPAPDHHGERVGRIDVSLPSLLSIYTKVPVLYQTMRSDFWKGRQDLVLTIHSRWYIEYGQFIFNEHHDRRRSPRFEMAPQRDSTPSIYYTYTVTVPRKDVAKWIKASTVVKLRLTYSEQSFVAACLLGKITYYEKTWARSMDILFDIEPPGPHHQVGMSGPTGPLIYPSPPDTALPHNVEPTPKTQQNLNGGTQTVFSLSMKTPSQVGTDIYAEVRPQYPQLGLVTEERLASTSAVPTQGHDTSSEWLDTSHPIPPGIQECESNVNLPSLMFQRRGILTTRFHHHIDG